MSNSKNSIADQLKKAGIRVENSLSNEDIKTEVAKKGYSEEELLNGRAKISAATKAVQDQVSKAGIAESSTAFEAKCKKEAHIAYQNLGQILRAKYSANSPQLTKIGLIGSEPASTANFIKAGYLLFDNAKSDAEISSFILNRGYTTEFIDSERAKITAYEKANQDQQTAQGNAIKATEIQTNALKEMNDWVSEYTAVAKVALRQDKKLLEKIGIFTGKRSPAKKKAAVKNTPPPAQ